MVRTEQGSKFKEQRVIVTGATSGIGAAVASWFAERGARLLLTGRDRSRGEEVAGRMSEAASDTVFMAGDVRDDAFCVSLVDAAVKRWDGLDVLVNSAGVLYRGDALQTTDAQWQTTLATNVSAVFYLSRAALKVMQPQGSGAIVNVASDWGLVGGEKAVAYCASKGAVVLMTKAMALDHAREGIRINAVCPGDTDTPMIDHELAQLGLSAGLGKAEYARAIPMGRLGSVDDVAAAVGFLASAQAGFMTGVALPVDGGHTAG